MPVKKPVTTKRGQYHKSKSFRINLVKDATLEKIDSNILRNKPETFEKKKVTFEKKNADPSYFREKLCEEFPSLQGNEFSLWRLGCTNANKETKTSLISLPPEINNAVALCDCDELNRSCLYIKLQAAPASHPVPSPQPHSSDSADEDDSIPSLSSSPRRISTTPDLLPTETNPFRYLPPPLPTVTQPVFTFNETPQNSDQHQLQSLVSHSVPSSMEPFTSKYFIVKENQLLDMTLKVQASSTRDTENRHPKKRKFLLDNANNFEPTEYTDVNGSQANETDEMEELKQSKNSQFMSLDRATFFDVGGQQPTTMSYTALLSDHTLIPESAQQTRTMDFGYPYQIAYLNPSDFVDLQNNANEVSSLRGMSGHNNGFGEPLTASNLPSLLYNVTGTTGLQDSAQQWGAVNSISTNAHISLGQSRPIQTSDSLRTDLNEVNATNGDSMNHTEITKHMEFLLDRMDPDFGLLDIMIASKDLAMAEFHQIRSQPTIEDRNLKLLQCIIKKNKSDKLTAALQKAKQIHLVNYLNSDGKFKEGSGESWPLLENQLQKLTTNRHALIEGLDSSYLSYKLYFKDVINKRQHEFILSKPTNSEKNEVLLEILRRGSIKQYNQTIESLQELNQDRILNVLQQSGKGLIATIRTKAAEEEKKPIYGLTILDEELFVVSDNSSEVEVYDSMKFSFSRRWNLKELIDPWDIVSCNRNKCLYISDYKGDEKLNEILRIDPNGTLIKKWSTEGDCGRLSVTYESNVILTVNKSKLNEYLPDGHLIREIKLSSDGSFRDLWHAIKLTNGHFVVSHGRAGDDLHRVCIVDADGKLLKSFGGKCGSTIGQTNVPIHLSVDGNGFVMVADQKNGRVLLLDSDLKFKREILSEEHGLRNPTMILLDESNGRLLVADNELDCEKNIIEDGQILIFDFK